MNKPEMLPKIQAFVNEKLNLDPEDKLVETTELSEGKSGALVYLIKVNSRQKGLSGYYIVKCIDKKGHYFSLKENEGMRARILHRNSGLFKNHLVELKCCGACSEYYVVVYTYANNSVFHSTALDKLPPSEIIKQLRVLSYELLSLWNPDPEKSTDNVNIFHDLLKYRIEPDGSFATKTWELLTNSEENTIAILDKLYPNPSYFVLNDSHFLDSHLEHLCFLKGNCHGDLHSKNIICWFADSQKTQSRYSIIDYDSYSECQYLLFDHAYLELYVFLSLFKDISDIQKWSSECLSALRVSLFEDINQPGNTFVEARNALCFGIKNWISENEPKLIDDLSIQHRICRIAAGINFFSKGAITDPIELKKIYTYICINFEMLFRELNIQNKTEGIAQFRNEDYATIDIDILWKSCVKRIKSGFYTPILITDDHYDDGLYPQIADIYRLKWAAIIDIGSRNPPNDLASTYPSTIGGKEICLYNLSDIKNIEYNSNKTLLIDGKKDPSLQTYFEYWLNNKAYFSKFIRGITAAYENRPLIYVFDISSKTSDFPKWFAQHVIPDHCVKYSAFCILYEKSDDDELQRMNNILINDFHCVIENYRRASLVELSCAVRKYVPDNTQQFESFSLPSKAIGEYVIISDKEQSYYSTCLEVVYINIETRDKENDHGDSFYMGNEVSWRDLLNYRDISIIEDYTKKIQFLKDELNETGRRVKETRLVHGAGTGGTTLSKRILWDLHKEYPCVRLIKFSSDTVEIIVNIYEKCKRRVVVTVECGSTVITQEQLKTLKDGIRARNGKVLFILIERKSVSLEYDPSDILMEISDVLPVRVANTFYETFKEKTSDSSRVKNLRQLCSSTKPEWEKQRCAFFFGFYTYIEKYNVGHTIKETIATCSESEKKFLSDMAFVTIYSQNICIPCPELLKRFPDAINTENFYMGLEYFSLSKTKFIINKGLNKGFRICHPFIAKRILEEIWTGKDSDKYHKNSYVIYSAAIAFIDRMYQYYGNDNTDIDTMMKELFIDRSSEGGEKMRFSQFINDLTLGYWKELVFKKLIDCYPDNPHYYNHLARLLTVNNPNFDKAIEYIETAINIAQSRNDSDISIHYNTLGIVLDRKMREFLNSEKNAARLGRASLGLRDIIEELDYDYQCAREAFVTAQDATDKIDSYTFFPALLMEYNLINGIVQCDRNRRTLRQLFNEDAFFADWYQVHLGRALENFKELRIWCQETEQDIIDNAKSRIDQISIINRNAIINKLKVLLDNIDYSSPSRRRVYTNMLYSNANYCWRMLNQEEISLALQSIEKNFTSMISKTEMDYDATTWFEIYRCSDDFDPLKAIQIIDDFMKDSYKKEYYLFIMNFLLLEKGLSVRDSVIVHLKRCVHSVPRSRIGISVWRDVYEKTDRKRCPIIDRSEVSRNARGIICNLKDYTGTILSITSQTEGKILLDDMRLDVFFSPVYTNESGLTIAFDKNNERDRVVFNLMFAYSGLRAWNVRALRNKDNPH